MTAGKKAVYMVTGPLAFQALPALPDALTNDDIKLRVCLQQNQPTF